MHSPKPFQLVRVVDTLVWSKGEVKVDGALMESLPRKSILGELIQIEAESRNDVQNSG